MSALRWLVATGIAVGVVWALRAILGPILAALIVGPALWLAVIAGWSMVERKLFPDHLADYPPPRRRDGPVIDVTTSSPVRHYRSGPSHPVGPTRPSGPSHPVGPTRPSGPSHPVGPVGPEGPWYPTGP